MMQQGVVNFDYAAWAAIYPELAGSVSAPQAQNYFVQAELYCDNTPCSPVRNVQQRAMLLYLAMSHIVQLNAPINGQASSQLVGRVVSATEGSVSVGVADMGNQPGNAAWWQQTKYGAQFWAATAQFRTMHYVARRPPPANPFNNGLIGIN